MDDEVIRLHPLTEAEKERRPGRFVGDLLKGNVRGDIRAKPAVPSDLIDRVLQGGFPEVLRRPRLPRVRHWHRDYIGSLIERDARDVANLRNLDHLAKLLAVLCAQTGELLEIERLARHLGIRRETVQNNIAALERLFLVRTLSAWHRTESRRLIKAPKVHLVDSGLAATLAGLEADDWTTRRDRFGHLVETFAVQQIIAQSAWTDPDLRFWHYRDKDQVEVDLVITRGRRTWGVEVKASATMTPSDGRGLRRLADQCGRDFQRGIILHAGTSTVPTADPRVLAVPLSELWAK